MGAVLDSLDWPCRQDDPSP